MEPAPTINLNGLWNMQPEARSLDQPKSNVWVKAPVPMPWSSFLDRSTGIPPDKVPRRMAWFQRQFVVPDIPPQSRLLLHFEAVNFFCRVLIGDKLCGEHVGDALPFDIDLTDVVLPRQEATLLVGVQDLSAAEARAMGVAADHRLLYPGIGQYPGIWGNVSLRLAPCLHIADVIVATTVSRDRITNQEGRLHVRVAVQNETKRTLSFSLTNELYDGARQVIALAPVRGVAGPGERTELDMETSWESAALWWPDHPRLYSLRTALWAMLPGTHSEDVADRRSTQVALREFRIEGRQFTLNGVPMFLYSESLCPISGRVIGDMKPDEPVQPVSPAQAAELLQAIRKRRVINTVRFHQIPPSPALLNAADELGLLAIVEFPLPGDEQPYSVDHPKFWSNTQRLIREWVLANGHHPSIVMWSLDQGMIRRYGPGVIEGLQSLSRFLGELDPARPVLHDGDGGRIAAADPTWPSPVSHFFQHSGISLRSAAPFEPPEIEKRLLPGPPSETVPATERPPEQPVCMLDQVRLPLTPNGLAFFLGEAAYAAGKDLSELAAPLALLGMNGCRMSGLAAVSTIGRPVLPAGTSDAAAPLTALPRQFFGNFYAGTRFTENLVLRNDTRFDQDCELRVRFTTAHGDAVEGSSEALMKAGTQAEKAVGFPLQDTTEVQDAGTARSTIAEFSVWFKGGRMGLFESQRKIGIWPHVRAKGDRRIGLHDPDGRTASALASVGARYAAVQGDLGGSFDTLIIGEDALEHGVMPDRNKVRSFVEAGGLAVILAQDEIPYDLAPVPLILDAARPASIAFVRDAEHPLLAGLTAFDLRWWQDDHLVARSCFRKPSLGNFRCLVDAGGPGGLRWAAVIEVFHGRGSYLFCQLGLVEKAARVPVAALLLARLADAQPSWSAAEIRMLGHSRRFANVGVRCAEVPAEFGEADIAPARVLLSSGRALAQVASERLLLLRQWVKNGGTLYVHSLAPAEQHLSYMLGRTVTLLQAPQDRLVFVQAGHGVARGLSSAALYWVDHGSRFWGTSSGRVRAAEMLIQGADGVTEVASAFDSPTRHALVRLPLGNGEVILDQVRWHVSTALDTRPQQYISTLLTNLGVPLHSREAALSAQCRPLDISAVCNASLDDPIPFDGSGWTGRGPENDLSAFSPGMILAPSIPFVVRGAPSCCVLGPAGPPAAPPIPLGMKANGLAFLIACEGRAKHGVTTAHFTVHYEDGLETRLAIRYGIDVVDWNERATNVDGASVAWKGATRVGEPAVLYSKVWKNNRPQVAITSIVLSSTRIGVTPILLAATAVVP